MSSATFSPAYAPGLCGVLTALFALSGCVSAGPDYAMPENRLPDAFAQADSPLYDSAEPRTIWRDFNDPVLMTLIERGRANNTDVVAAVARLNESRALSGLSVYSLFPTVTSNASSERNRQSTRDPFTFPGLSIAEIKRLQFDSVWEIDLFGSLKRQKERIARRVETDEALLADVQRSVVAEIAQSYFSLLGTQNQLRVQRDSVAAQARVVDILQRSLDAGRGNALDVARAQVLERTLASALPPLEQQIAMAQQRLAVLTADSAQSVVEKLAESADAGLPPVPVVVRVGEPDSWLQRRPDVRAAERSLAGATATVGVESAELYPKLNLVGDFGYSGTQFGDWGDPQARRWTFGPSLQWRFLDYGRVKQNVRAAEAGQQQALANFQGAVLRALEDMENALATFRAISQTCTVLQEAHSASKRATELAQLRFDHGASDYLEVLDARRTELDLTGQVAVAQTARLTALTAIYKALAVF